MKADIPIKEGITIPGHEVEITTSRAGGPGGQHANKANTKVTLHWNVAETTALTDAQKERVQQKLASELTGQGELVVHSSAHRSQKQNRNAAIEQLAKKVNSALSQPKKRVKTKEPQAAKETRLKKKKERSALKKLRKKHMD